MKSELFSTAVLVLLCFNACCKGMKLVFNRDIQAISKSYITCGILFCEENLPPTSTSSSLIFNMTVFKNQPSCSETSKDESETRVPVAWINSTNLNVSPKNTKYISASGNLGRKIARLKVYMFTHEDCSPEYTCELLGVDSKGSRVFVSTTTLLQQQRDVNMGYDILTKTLREVNDKVVLLQDKFETAFTAIGNQVQSLENRMDSFENKVEDKIHAKLSAANNVDTESALEKKLSTLKRELSVERNRYMTIVVDYIDARLVSDQLQLINNVKSLTSARSIDDTLKNAFDIISSQKLSQERLIKFWSYIFNSTNKTQSVLGAIDRQLSHMDRPLATELKSSLDDIIQPSTCKRDMIRPSSSYPYPHPVIYPRDESGQGLPYLCDMFTDGGGWIVIQRRSSSFNVDFYREWDTYKKGFGTFDDDFWLGNERIHAFTSKGTWELRVDLKYKGKEVYALYSNFKLESESEKYKLRVGTYRGTAGDSLSYHNGRMFSTLDRDNDENSGVHCAVFKLSGWWFSRTGTSGNSDLNSKKRQEGYTGILWFDFCKKDSCSFSEMKIRRVG
ncbi:fibrinogen-related protein 3.2 [Plakobranchus ocellatus]|uniref:Fibrinogen-related protein 3.2 n=1 Tax=Plakobranchus ocellatus TaxID=259542 RepID=A0AAV4AEU3_9GAST|nr:fibrinogen-related protein 3.2 [Plakobranchus ocellatus]